MPINERVRKLRQQSLDAPESVSSERAELVTEFYKSQSSSPSISIPVQRAMLFSHLMEHKTITIGEGELIVGEKGTEPKAAPTYPELCCHSLEDLDILDSRPKTSFKVSPQTRSAYEERIIPFWEGRSLRDRLFREMTDDWKAAFEAGIFTEFMEQRSPGHTVLDGKIYKKGMLDFIDDINSQLESLDFLHDPQAYARQEELKAMRICAAALIRLGERYADEAQKQAKEQKDPARSAELKKIAEVCQRMSRAAPRATSMRRCNITGSSTWE